MLPVAQPISGVRNAVVKALTTAVNAAPITTPTARPTTLPRTTNLKKPFMGPPGRSFSTLTKRTDKRCAAACHIFADSDEGALEQGSVGLESRVRGLGRLDLDTLGLTAPGAPQTRHRGDRQDADDDGQRGGDADRGDGHRPDMLDPGAVQRLEDHLHADEAQD